MVLVKNTNKFKRNMIGNAIINFRKHYHRNCHLNGVDTGIKIIKLKRSEVGSVIAPLKDPSQHECYFISNTKGLTTLFFKKKYDVVAIDNNHHITDLIKAVSPNKGYRMPKSSKHLFVFKTGTIDFYKLSLGQNLFTY